MKKVYEIVCISNIFNVTVDTYIQILVIRIYRFSRSI